MYSFREQLTTVPWEKNIYLSFDPFEGRGIEREQIKILDLHREKDLQNLNYPDTQYVQKDEFIKLIEKCK